MIRFAAAALVFAALVVQGHPASAMPLTVQYELVGGTSSAGLDVGTPISRTLTAHFPNFPGVTIVPGAYLSSPTLLTLSLQGTAGSFVMTQTAYFALFPVNPGDGSVLRPPVISTGTNLGADWSGITRPGLVGGSGVRVRLYGPISAPAIEINRYSIYPFIDGFCCYYFNRGTLNATGQEVMAPEPGGFPLLAMGGLLLVAFGWRRMRRG